MMTLATARPRILTGRGSIPHCILLVTAVHMGIEALALLAWCSTGDVSWVVQFFHYQGTLFLCGMSAAGVWLSSRSWLRFSRGEPLRPAWFLITLAASCYCIGSTGHQLLSSINGAAVILPSFLGLKSQALNEVVMIIGGPLQSFLLAVGSLFVLRAYRIAGVLRNMTRCDWILIVPLIAFVGREAFDVKAALSSGRIFSLLKMIRWTNEPLLVVLLIQAIVIRRTLLSIGRGLFARCWGAFVAAIAFTALGEIVLWAEAYEYLPWRFSSIGWYVWFLASAAYTLGPGFQVEASRQVSASSARLTLSFGRTASGRAA